MKPRILVIDDEAAIRDSLKMILEYEGYECLLAPSAAEGIAAVEREPPDLIFLDIKMPGMDGLEALGRLRSLDETVPIVIVSGHGTTETALKAGQLGAFRFIEKPLSREYVLDAVQGGLEIGRLRHENVALRSALDVRHELVGTSPALARVTETVARAAPTTATVLILGESGVGKELVARAVHRNSPRGRERFVQVNCAAIPDDLIESELFGHEKGSFTGATEKQVGKFEQADRGTIFLDEIGDMSLRTQAKVLRVLQEGEVERLGSAKTFKVDVRVIAATNKELEDEIAGGRFREDLYYRLSVIPIVVPPLRERRDDIPLLVKHFTDRFVRESSARPKRFTPEAMALLQQARWRGNVRELRNTVERLLIMSPAEAIGEADVREAVRVDAGLAGPDNGRDGPPGTLREFKEVSERAFLVQKLREHNWNISRTAEVIGTPRSNLYKKLDQYRIRQETDG